ncbi:MAG: hypothetical protein WBX27_16990 [Specibacter sp.]
MNPIQTRNGITPEDGDLGQATVRELIVQLALVEDEHRNTAIPGQLAALARREHAIVAALHRHGLAFKVPCSPNASAPRPVPCRPDVEAAQE